MDIDEVRDYVKSRPKEYLKQKHGIIIKGNENSKCPVCGGSDKSSKFSIQKNNYMKCFSCGFGGDVLDLIADDNGLDKRDFQEVIKIACEEFGLPLLEEKESYNKKPRQQEKQETMTEAYLTTQTYDFTDIILQAHQEVSGTDYFTKRGFSQELIQKYRLGYSKQGYNALLQNIPNCKLSQSNKFVTGILCQY